MFHYGDPSILHEKRVNFPVRRGQELILSACSITYPPSKVRQFCTKNVRISRYKFRTNKFCLGVHRGIFDPTFYESRLAPLASLGLQPRLACFAARIMKIWSKISREIINICTLCGKSQKFKVTLFGKYSVKVTISLKQRYYKIVDLTKFLTV